MFRSFVSSFKSGKEYYVDKDIDFYCKEVVQHKIKQNWKLAGQSYVEIGKLYESLKEYDDVCENYINAAKCYKKSAIFNQTAIT